MSFRLYCDERKMRKTKKGVFFAYCKCFSFLFLIVTMITVAFFFSSCGDDVEGDVEVSDPLPDSRKSGSYENSDYRWDAYTDYIEIVSYIGKQSNVTVPDFLDGLPVMSIGEGAFTGSSVESVELPKTVVKICDKAFFKCSSLKSVVMPNVVIIEMSAFRDSSLETVDFPATLQSIGKYAFENTCLKSITIPESVVFIGEYLFSGCKSLENFEIKSSNAEITARMFYGCSSLTDVTISDNIVKICDYAFAYCDNLNVVTIPKNVSAMGFGIFYKTPNVVVKTVSGSEAESYAQKNGVKYELIK